MGKKRNLRYESQKNKFRIIDNSLIIFPTVHNQLISSYIASHLVLAKLRQQQRNMNKNIIIIDWHYTKITQPTCNMVM